MTVLAIVEPELTGVRAELSRLQRELAVARSALDAAQAPVDRLQKVVAELDAAETELAAGSRRPAYPARMDGCARCAATSCAVRGDDRLRTEADPPASRW
jgi:hypothetical protein